MGRFLKPAYRKKQKSAFKPICPTCGMELDAYATSNARAAQILASHRSRAHYGLGI